MMRKRNKGILLLFMFFLIHSKGISQVHETNNYGYEPRKEDAKYYADRERISTPSFGLEKLKKLIKNWEVNVPTDHIVSDMNVGISKSEFSSLSFEEKFTYTMIHPEIFSQNCAESIYYTNPQNKIFGEFVSIYPTQAWSDRQIAFLESDSKKLSNLIRKTIEKDNLFGINLKEAVVTANVTELIPFMIQYYSRNKQDKDVLTTLLLLLKNNAYLPFMQSKIYKKLYDTDTFGYNFVLSTAANEKFILESANAYFRAENINK